MCVCVFEWCVYEWWWVGFACSVCVCVCGYVCVCNHLEPSIGPLFYLGVDIRDGTRDESPLSIGLASGHCEGLAGPCVGVCGCVYVCVYVCI